MLNIVRGLNSVRFPAVCGHVENPRCRRVNDYNGKKQRVDSGQEGDGRRMKCPHTHFVKPVERQQDALKHSRAARPEICFSLRGWSTFRHTAPSSFNCSKKVEVEEQ